MHKQDIYTESKLSFAETIFNVPCRNLIGHEKFLSVVRLCINIDMKI